MSCFEQSLPIIVYFLLIILVIVLIVVLVRAFFVLNKVDKMIDNVNDKINSLENLFSIIDGATDTFALISDKIVGFISAGIGKLFKKKEEDKNE